jgi:hypothetical protein
MQDVSPFEYPQQRKAGLSGGAKIAIGCGVVALVVILVCGGILLYLWQAYRLDYDTFARDFEARGYVRVHSNVLEVTQTVSTPTVFTGNVVSIRANSDADIAIMANVAEIQSTINGDVDFEGNVLTVHPQAVITGDLRVTGAQVTEIQGTVHGQTVGIYPSPTRTTVPPGPRDPSPPGDPDDG